jgi:hypothetical protein
MPVWRVLNRRVLSHRHGSRPTTSVGYRPDLVFWDRSETMRHYRRRTGAQLLAGNVIHPVSTETYDNGVGWVVFRDADGNEFAFGAMPVDSA